MEDLFCKMELFKVDFSDSDGFKDAIEGTKPSGSHRIQISDNGSR